MNGLTTGQRFVRKGWTLTIFVLTWPLNRYSCPNIPIPNFIFNFSTFMGLKINAFWVIMEKQDFWADILDFGAAILEFCMASGIFEKSGIWRVYVPNFMLVSPFEQFLLYLQLSAPLMNVNEARRPHFEAWPKFEPLLADLCGTVYPTVTIHISTRSAEHADRRKQVLQPPCPFFF